MKKLYFIFFGVVCLGLTIFYWIDEKNQSASALGEEIKAKEVYQETWVTIEITGEVLRPGKYQLPADWTTTKVLEFVGVKDTADQLELPVKSPLSQGMKIHVPKIKDGLVSINTATKEELASVDGIGTVIAESIIAYRKIKKFDSLEELLEVARIGQKTLDKIRPFLTL